MIGRNQGGERGVVATMQTFPLRPAALATIILVASLVAACSDPSSPSVDAGVSPPAASANPTPSGPLVTVETRGGMCPQGACDSTIAIDAGGRVRTIAPVPRELGVLPDDVLEALITVIAQADFVSLKGHPFTGTCPLAFDGQETIYTVTTASGAVRLASCDVVVDPAAPLFVAIAAALGHVAPPG
jgi:hypothetical protein